MQYDRRVLRTKRFTFEMEPVTKPAELGVTAHPVFALLGELQQELEDVVQENLELRQRVEHLESLLGPGDETGEGKSPLVRIKER